MHSRLEFSIITFPPWLIPLGARIISQSSSTPSPSPLSSAFDRKQSCEGGELAYNWTHSIVGPYIVIVADVASVFASRRKGFSVQIRNYTHIEIKIRLFSCQFFIQASTSLLSFFFPLYFLLCQNLVGSVPEMNSFGCELISRTLIACAQECVHVQERTLPIL